VRFVGFPCNHDGSKGSTLCAIESDHCREPWYLQRVNDQHITVGIKPGECRRFSTTTLSNYEKIGSFAEEPDKRFTQQTVLNQ
jgi:hypothetical protein